MAEFRGDRLAFGAPGREPRWTPGNKDGIGTATRTSSRIWFSLWNGIVTEVYYPTIDRPQVGTVQCLLTDGATFFHEERRDTYTETARLSPHVLGYRITNSDREGRYAIEKQIITHPDLPCLLQHTRLVGYDQFLAGLKLYVSCLPRLNGGGRDNNAYVMQAAGRDLLVAEKAGTWLAMAATAPFLRLSCGYDGTSDGISDLAANYAMDWEFDRATAGTVMLTGEVALEDRAGFTLGLALGDTQHSAITTLFQALDVPFKRHLREYSRLWNGFCRSIEPLEAASQDGGDLYHASYSLLTSHEDKTYPGAFIASLSIPWGEARGDADLGGYHLVWTRDMVSTATGLLAAGNTGAPRRALIYLAASQQPDGGFPQNFWLNGNPLWQGIQLDEVAFPILLAWKLHANGGTGDFDPYPMVMRAAGYLIRHGPATQQERWEENSGYSPSTLASNIAALICAASLCRERGDAATADFLCEYADFLECHLETWTVTGQGRLVPGIPRHYVRINPVSVTDFTPHEKLEGKLVAITNRRPGGPWEYPASDIVDAGFLELVRYGIRRPGDPLVAASLEVVDAILKVETPFGPCWRRYNHDGYGQRDGGEPYEGWGTGRAWPLLTGERGHYECAAGRDTSLSIRAMEGFATYTGLLPEQVWDAADIPEAHFFLGRPTGSAMPLMWAHAEYIKLLRSVRDGRVFDFLPAVADRYLRPGHAHGKIEIWKPNRQARAVKAGWRLRVQAPRPFDLIWTADEWRTTRKTAGVPTNLGISYVDLEVVRGQAAPFHFTFFWTDTGAWEGQNYTVVIDNRVTAENGRAA